MPGFANPPRPRPHRPHRPLRHHRYARLDRFDDRMLRDVGLTRLDVKGMRRMW